MRSPSNTGKHHAKQHEHQAPPHGTDESYHQRHAFAPEGTIVTERPMRADGAKSRVAHEESYLAEGLLPPMPLHDVVQRSIYLHERLLAFTRHKRRTKRGWSQPRVHPHDKLQDHPSLVRAMLAVRNQHLRVLAKLQALAKLLLWRCGQVLVN